MKGAANKTHGLKKEDKLGLQTWDYERMGKMKKLEKGEPHSLFGY